MSRIEKIAFIASFWSLFQVTGNLEFSTDNQLDKIIQGILNNVKDNKAINAILHVRSMPVFLN